MNKKSSKPNDASKRGARRVKAIQLPLELVSRSVEYRDFMLTSDEIKYIRGDAASVYQGLSK